MRSIIVLLLAAGCSSPAPPYVCVPAGAAASLDGPIFVEADEELGITALDTVGVLRAQVVDLDGDGREDMVLTGYGTLNEAGEAKPFFVLRRGDDGKFADVTAASGLDGMLVSTSVWGDLDGDGDVDLVNFVPPNEMTDVDEASRGVWLNDGTGHLDNKGLKGTALGQFDNPHSITLADLDRDGALDIYVVNWYSTDGFGNLYLDSLDRVFKGNGDGSFEDVTEDALGDQPSGDVGIGRPGFGAAPGDYDDDGDIDLFISSYGAGRPIADAPPDHSEHNVLWRNDGDMTFTDVAGELGLDATFRGIGGIEDESETPGPVIIGGVTYYQPIGGNTFGSLFADIDNDGDLDLLVTNIAHPDYPQSDRTLLYLGSGAPDYTFTEVSADIGLFYREYELFPGIADFDNDGLQDYAIAGQWAGTFGGNNWELYHQSPDHTLEIMFYADSGVDHTGQAGWNWLDVDDDGDLDIVLAAFEGPMRMYRNVAGDRNDHLVFDLDDGGAPVTGARVTLESTAGPQLREVTNGSSHGNQQLTTTVYFGLGGDGCASQVRVRWPDGETTEVGDLEANKRMVITREGATERPLTP